MNKFFRVKDTGKILSLTPEDTFNLKIDKGKILFMNRTICPVGEAYSLPYVNYDFVEVEEVDLFYNEGFLKIIPCSENKTL